MKRHDVKKVLGRSWIEVKDKRHISFAEDVLHSERDDIYQLLALQQLSCVCLKNPLKKI